MLPRLFSPWSLQQNIPNLKVRGRCNYHHHQSPRSWCQADECQHDFSVKQLFWQKEEPIPPLGTPSILGTSVEHLCGVRLSSPVSVPEVSTDNQADRPETGRAKMTHSADLNNSNKQHAFHFVPINMEQIRRRSDSTPPVFLCKTDADSSWPWSWNISPQWEWLKL